MALFNKKIDINFDGALVKEHSVEERRLNSLMMVAAHLSQSEPEVALALIEDVTEHPLLWRTRGWSYATLEDLDSSLNSFEKGFALGDIRCGVYAHRLLRDHTSDRKRFEAMEVQLKPYFDKRNPDLIMAQAKLSIEKGDINSAITNHITYMSSEITCDAGSAAAIFQVYRALVDSLVEKIMSDAENTKEDETEAWFEAMDHFFKEELKTAEGDGLGWDHFIYLVSVGICLEKEIEQGNFQSASMMPEFAPLYLQMIEIMDPPIWPKIYSVEEIAKALVNSIDRGDIYSLHIAAPVFFEENNLRPSILKKYQDEFDAWGFKKYLGLD